MSWSSYQYPVCVIIEGNLGGRKHLRMQHSLSHNDDSTTYRCGSYNIQLVCDFCRDNP